MGGYMKKGEKIVAIIVVVLIAGFGVIQLIPVDRTNPPVESEIQAPLEVKAILKVSCYDCHSHEINWPWYSRVAPVSWLIASDAAEAREKINFSTWNRYTPERQVHLIAEAMDEIREGGMPPWYYSWKHPGSEVTSDELKVLEAWAKQYAKPGQKMVD
jgi:hypothetical protein